MRRYEKLEPSMKRLHHTTGSIDKGTPRMSGNVTAMQAGEEKVGVFYNEVEDRIVQCVLNRPNTFKRDKGVLFMQFNISKNESLNISIISNRKNVIPSAYINFSTIVPNKSSHDLLISGNIMLIKPMISKNNPIQSSISMRRTMGSEFKLPSLNSIVEKCTITISLQFGGKVVIVTPTVAIMSIVEREKESSDFAEEDRVYQKYLVEKEIKRKELREKIDVNAAKVENYLEDKILGLVSMVYKERSKQEQAKKCRRQVEEVRKRQSQLVIKRRTEMRLLERTTKAVTKIDVHFKIIRTDWAILIWFFKMMKDMWDMKDEEKRRKLKSYKYISMISLMQRVFKSYIKYHFPPLGLMPFRQTKQALFYLVNVRRESVVGECKGIVMRMLAVIYRTMRLRRDMTIFAMSIKSMTKRLMNHMMLKMHMMAEMRMVWDREVKRVVEIDLKKLLTRERILPMNCKIDIEVKNKMIEHFLELELIRYMNRKLDKWMADRRDEAREKKMLRRMTVLKVLTDIIHDQSAESATERKDKTSYNMGMIEGRLKEVILNIMKATVGTDRQVLEHIKIEYELIAKAEYPEFTLHDSQSRMIPETFKTISSIEDIVRKDVNIIRGRVPFSVDELQRLIESRPSHRVYQEACTNSGRYTVYHDVYRQSYPLDPECTTISKKSAMIIHRTTKKIIEMNNSGLEDEEEINEEEGNQTKNVEEEQWKKKVASNYWMKKFLKNTFTDKLSFEVSLDMRVLRNVILYCLTNKIIV